MVREFLEKNYKDDMTREETVKLTVKSLLEVVQTGAKNIEITVMDGYEKIVVSDLIWCSSWMGWIPFCAFRNKGERRGGQGQSCYETDSSLVSSFLECCLHLQNLESTEIEALVKEIEQEKEAEAEKKRTRQAATAQVRRIFHPACSLSLWEGSRCDRIEV